MNNSEEMFRGYAEELEKRARREAALKLAWATPLPGPLGEAFGGAQCDIAGVLLRAVTLGDLLLLTQLGSPLVPALTKKMAGEEFVAEGETIQLDDFDVAEAAFLWSQPHAEARRRLRDSLPGFKARAWRWIARVDSERRAELAEGVVLHLFRAFRTSVALRVPAANRVEGVIQYGESADGFGWWLCLLGTMMRDFGMSRDYALEELPLAQAFALQAWGQYSAGHGLELESDGYIAQEAQARFAAMPAESE